MSPILTGVIASGISGNLTPPFNAGAYDSLAAVTLSTATSSITFAGIPTGYKHLQIRGIALTSSPNNNIAIRFNSDSSSNYSVHELYASGAAADSLATANSTFVPAGFSPGSTNPGSFVMNILEYYNTNIFKTTRTLWGYDNNGSGYVGLSSGNWRSTSAISSITIFHTSGGANFNQYSNFALYGVK